MIAKDKLGTYRKQDVCRYTLTNKTGASIQILNFGLRLESIKLPDKNGTFENVVLAYQDWEAYLNDPHYLGAAIGRYANRIKHGRFLLKGEKVQLSTNNNGHHLHGGRHGFHKAIWQHIKSDQVQNCLVFKLESPHNEEGFPGNVCVKATICWAQNNKLQIQFEATTDQPTILNLTWHPYFNLSGKANSSIQQHLLKLNAESILEVDQDLIPTGKTIKTKESKVFNFSSAKNILEQIESYQALLKNTNKGYDHCFTSPLNTEYTALLSHPKSGRSLKITTNYPAFQVFTGQRLIVETGTKGLSKSIYPAICIEPQYCPDAPNMEQFQTPLITPEKKYEHYISYQFNT